MRRLAPLALIAVLGLVAGGCDTSRPGGKVVSPTPETVVGTVPKDTTATKTVPAEFAKGDPVAGKKVFVSGPCAGCHTLKAAGTNGTVGPNLDQSAPDLVTIVDRVTNGKGAMPSFKGQLSNQEIADVSAFVFQSTHTGSTG